MTLIERLEALETACAEVTTWTPPAIVALPQAELAWFVQKNLPAIISALRQPTPDAMPMDAALISAYSQGFADGAEDQRDCDADETPHNDCISEGFQNWLSNNPRAAALKDTAHDK